MTPLGIGGVGEVETFKGGSLSNHPSNHLFSVTLTALPKSQCGSNIHELASGIQNFPMKRVPRKI